MGWITIFSDAITIALIGLVGTIFTGAIVKYFDYRLNKIKHDFDERVHLRSASNEDLKTLKEELELRREEIRILENELDEWKGKYYEILENLIELRGKLSG
jgi:F0F1-type ATP synthase membrane subunit b/b'